MKMKSWVTFSFSIAGMAIILLNCSRVDNQKDYLQKVLNNLRQIKSATYYTTTEAWAPGDTAASAVYYHYVKEYDNPSDTTIGASFVSLLQDDTTHMTFCYDGRMRAVVYDDEGKITIDSFSFRPLPFRPLTPPFFNYTKSIIDYALDTKDSISLFRKDLKDSYYFSLTIFEDHQVEFFGKAHYMENTPYDGGETTSKYELWVDKSTDLPYRVRREMPENIMVTTCRDSKINNLKMGDFKATDYFEPGYAIERFGHDSTGEPANNLTGSTAPAWILNDANGHTIALKDIKSPVLMIQFTSVSCGPCRASIPFLKHLVTEYDLQQFDFIAIESWTQNVDVLKSYQRRNTINYKFVMSTKEVTRSYQIRSVPVFFILDKQRVIRKVIRGYGEGSTDKEIRDAINQLIEKL
jgi:thiol-disulfide isomerase/thioredoxin